MFDSRQTSQRDNAPASRAEPDSDSASASASVSRKESTGQKRSRLAYEREEQNEPLPAACDQCRLRKIRCDRIQPECSNCRKSGIECNSSNTLKRVNHMKQLRDDFSDVFKQLSDVDHTLGVLTKITQQIASRPCSHAIHPYSPPHSSHTSPDPLPLSTSGLLDFFQHPSLDDGRVSSVSAAANSPFSETIKLDHGGERLYSYPAPLVLIKSVFHQGQSLLDDSDQQNEDHETGNIEVVRGFRDPAVRATLKRKLGDFPFNLPYREMITSSDASPVTTPPRLMVNLFVDGYLRNINARTPIFKDTKLHHAIDSHYRDEQLQDSRARALIINNIILLELRLEIQSGRASRSTSRVPNDDILPSFLRNCDRAIGNLSDFMAPSIVNLQALMTLTLAAQEFYSNATAERVCQAACQVGRVIGIHRSKDRPQSDEADTADSRARLFRILYTMDKQRVFMTGQPCDLHLFDSDQHIGPYRNQPDDEYSISDAFDHLMTIWEDIYLNLYSSRAVRASAETRLNQMRFVLSSLDRFAQTHAGLLSPPPPNTTDDADILRIELLYGYQVSQMLVFRCDQDAEQNQIKMHDLARSSLGLILEACKPDLTTARFALLARMFRRYPMVAFVELVNCHLITLPAVKDFDATALADITLLRGVCDKLEILQFDNLTHTFYARLSDGLVWALGTLEAMAEIVSRPTKPHGQGFSPQSQDSRRPAEESARNPTVSGPVSPAPDLFDPRSHSSRGSQDFTRLKSSSRQDDKDFGQGRRPPEMTNFGFFTPDPERVGLISAPLSPVYQPGGSAFAASQSQIELSSSSNWGNFNLDFLQGTFAQGNRWD